MSQTKPSKPGTSMRRKGDSHVCFCEIQRNSRCMTSYRLMRNRRYRAHWQAGAVFPVLCFHPIDSSQAQYNVMRPAQKLHINTEEKTERFASPLEKISLSAHVTWIACPDC